MSLNPPLLLTGCRTLREAGATGGVESLYLLSPQLRASCSLASFSTASASLKDATYWTACTKS